MFRTFALGVLLLFGSHSAANQLNTHVPVKYLKIHQQLSFIRGPVTNQQIVICDETTWKQWLAKSRQLSQLKVDFRKHMVLVYAEQPRGRGVRLAYVKARDVGKHIEAVFHMQPSAGIQQPADIVFPNHFVVVERSTKPVRFRVDFHPDWERFRLDDLKLKTTRMSYDKSAQPKLSVKVDGADLVVSTKIIANGSAHALTTSWQAGTKPHQIQLNYVLIQNRDRLVRCQKTVVVTWRLKGFAILPAPVRLSFQVKSQVLLLSTEELTTLLPQMKTLTTKLARG